MAWEYLLTKELDARAMVIAGYLANKITGKVILDLNCGHAPLLRYLPKTYARYYGNDTLAKRLPTCDGALFLPMTDEEMVTSDIGRVDVLVVMGMGGYEITKEKLESPTLTRSILALIEKHKPEIVILECIQEFECLADNIIFPHIKDDYSKEHDIKISIPMRRLGERLIKIYEALNRHSN